MPFDLKTALTMSDVRKRMRGKGGRAKIAEETLRRYCTKGAKLPDGTVAVLKTVRIGGVRYTTEQWLADFEALRLLGGMARPG